MSTIALAQRLGWSFLSHGPSKPSDSHHILSHTPKCNEICCLHEVCVYDNQSSTLKITYTIYYTTRNLTQIIVDWYLQSTAKYARSQWVFLLPLSVFGRAVAEWHQAPVLEPLALSPLTGTVLPIPPFYGPSWYQSASSVLAIQLHRWWGRCCNSIKNQGNSEREKYIFRFAYRFHF